MSVYQDHKPESGDSLYLKLKDGDKVKLRIASDPAVTTFDGEKLRYNWVVWNRDLKKAQVYSAGVSVFKQLAELYDEWGEPTEFDITIKRTGSGQYDTEYNVNPVPKSETLDSKERSAVKAVDLIDSCKGRWLSEYMEDGVMPQTLEKNDSKGSQSVSEMSDEELASIDAKGPINLDDIPL